MAGFRPPFRTRSGSARRIVGLVGFLAVLQFVLNSAALVLPSRVMVGTWLAAAVAAGWAAVLSESYKERRLR